MNITAIIEKFEIVDKTINNQTTKEIKLQLKGCGKYSFEFEINATKISYNILEPDNNTTDPEFLKSNTLFSMDTQTIGNTDIMVNLLSHAVIENKRLKFEIDENNGTYSITSISKVD
jgi:hypothetical protein